MEKSQLSECKTVVLSVLVRRWILYSLKMNSEEFRAYGKQMIDYIVDYQANIRDRQVAPTLDPGYLEPLIPCKY